MSDRKATHTDLVALLRERGAEKYAQIISNAELLKYHDYKSDPEKFPDVVCGKLTLLTELEAFPELADIRQQVIDGVYDEQMDEMDKKAMRIKQEQDGFSEDLMQGQFGLKPYCHKIGCMEHATFEVILMVRAFSTSKAVPTTPILRLCAEHNDVSFDEVCNESYFEIICKSFDRKNLMRPSRKHSYISIQPIKAWNPKPEPGSNLSGKKKKSK